MVSVVLYTRSDCELCEGALADLKSLEKTVPHKITTIDIESDPALLKKYNEIIPVLEIGPYTLKAPIDKLDLEVTLRAAEQGKVTSVKKSPSRSGLRLNKLLHSFARHWLIVFNLVVFIYASLPFAAPILMKSGYTRPASWIYTLYSPMCHQLAFRSWFLFGEQPAYPRSIAGTSLTSFEDATGLNEDEFLAARRYIGDERVGYKVALCERDIAIYGGIFLAGVLFSLVRSRIKPLPVWIWILVGIVPIALDGGTQLLSSINLFSFPVRESTPFLRTFTGALFGVMNVWLAYPHVERSMIETRALVAAKLAKVDDR
jgi:uncharacterized membrane protein